MSIVSPDSNVARYGYHALRGFPTTHLPYEPSWLVLFITARCNLRCRQCPYRSLESALEPQSFGDMRLDDFVRILERFPRTTSISLGGGEPLLHPDLLEMIRRAHQRRIKVHIPTNGTRLPYLVDSMLEEPVEMLNLSFYGTNEEEFTGITAGSGAVFKSIVKAAAQLAARRRRGGYPHILRASYVCHKQNLDQWIPFVRLCEEIGFDQVKLRNLRPWGIPGLEEDACLYEGDPEVNQLLAEMRAEQFKIPVYLPRRYKREPVRRRCDLLFCSLAMDSGGFMAPCCNIATEPRWGHFFRDGQVWNTPAIVRMRGEFLDPRKPLLDQCLHCEDLFPGRPHIGV
jgi:MoaA/NifB/PqqE/SkfB family radical SAM enzyme